MLCEWLLLVLFYRDFFFSPTITNYQEFAVWNYVSKKETTPEAPSHFDTEKLPQYGIPGLNVPRLSQLCSFHLHRILCCPNLKLTLLTQPCAVLSLSKYCLVGTSLAVQWLRLHISTAGGTGSILDQGTKIPCATWCSQKNKNKNKWINNYSEITELVK